METLPALRHEVWAWTPPEAQAYIRALEARVGDLDIHGPRLTRAGRHVAGTAAPDVTEFFPPPIERSATASTSTSPAGATPSWWSTGPSWLYAHPDTCGSSR